MRYTNYVYQEAATKRHFLRLVKFQKKIRGKTSLPHEMKRQFDDFDAMLFRIFNTNMKIQLMFGNPDITRPCC